MSEQITINLTQPQEEITFSYTEQGEDISFSFSEAARGPQGPSVTVDQAIIDGSTNAVSGNAVFDGLALKAPINNPTFTGIVTAPRIMGRCDGLEVLCKAGLSINAGQVVYVTGASGNNIIIGLAQSNTEPTSSKTIGISESTLATNATGYVITEGLLTVSISAPTANEGDPIWLSSTTAGGMVFGLANKPVAPNHIVYLGVVTRKTGNTVVEIYVKIQNGSELDELADVAITSPVAGQALMRGASLWENRSLVSADISDATSAATPSTIVKRNAQGGAEFAGTSSIAVSATSTSTTAVNAVSTNSTAVYGESGSSDGGFFASSSGTGLVAFSDSGDYHAKFGDTSGDNRSFVARVSGAFGWWRGAFRGFLQAPASITSSDKTWTLPNNTGTVALTTDEMTPSAAGLTSKFGTNKASIVDGDKVTILDSAASDTPKHVLWSLIVSTLTTAFDALYVGLTGNQTVAGNKTLSGQLELTGQSATNSTSAMSRALTNSEFIKNVGREYTLPSSSIVTASGGAASAAGSIFSIRMTSGTSLSGLARSNFSTNLIADYGSGSSLSRSVPFTLATSLRIRAITSDFTQVVFGIGIPATTAAYGSNITASRGIGFRIYYSTVNTRMELKMWANDGTTYSESSIIAIPFTSFFIQSLAIAWDGAGTYTLYSSGSSATHDNPRISITPIGTMTGLGSNLGWGEAANLSGISLYTNNSATNTPSVQTVVDAMQVRIILGQSIS